MWMWIWVLKLCDFVFLICLPCLKTDHSTPASRGVFSLIRQKWSWAIIQQTFPSFFSHLCEENHLQILKKTYNEQLNQPKLLNTNADPQFISFNVLNTVDNDHIYNVSIRGDQHPICLQPSRKSVTTILIDELNSKHRNWNSRLANANSRCLEQTIEQRLNANTLPKQ